MNHNDTDKLLVRFLERQNKMKAAQLVDNCGFTLLDTKHKLSILRTLLEAQLETNRKNGRFKRYLDTVNAANLRPQPIGRDANGNWYWKFNDKPSNSFVILKELVDEHSDAYFEYIRFQRQLHGLMSQISQTQVNKYCAGDHCKVAKYERDLIQCWRCKSKWHQGCLSDIELHYDQDEWQCPNCDEADLLDTLRGMLREE